MTYKIWRGNTEHTLDIKTWKDTYVVDGNYLNVCILREIVDGEDDLYWVMQPVHGEDIYFLTGVTLPVFLKYHLPNNLYNLIYKYNRQELDEQWEEFKKKYISEEGED